MSEDLIHLLTEAEGPDQVRAIIASASIDQLVDAGSSVVAFLTAPRQPEKKVKAAYPVPGPYEIAMTFGAAALASGRYPTIGAAMAAAWMAVPEFYMARDAYLKDLVPAVYGNASFAPGTEGETDAAAEDRFQA